MPEVRIRPLEDADVPAAHAVAHAALTGVSLRKDREPHVWADTEDLRVRMHSRMRHVRTLDPGGAWVADRDGEVVGVCLAVRREGLWMLSLLAVAEGLQGEGVGGRLLAAGRGTEAGSTSGIVLASRDPRALRRYHAAGFRLHPVFSASGRPDRTALPAGLEVRDGELQRDGERCDALVRERRGSGNLPDLAWMLGTGAQLLVDERGAGFTVTAEGRVLQLAAADEGTARRLLWAALAAGPEEADVSWMTDANAWAVDVALAARLSLSSGGAFCGRGALGPLTSYLPSGAWG